MERASSSISERELPLADFVFPSELAQELTASKPFVESELGMCSTSIPERELPLADSVFPSVPELDLNDSKLPLCRFRPPPIVSPAPATLSGDPAALLFPPPLELSWIRASSSMMTLAAGSTTKAKSR
jgi:hypothetical protein